MHQELLTLYLQQRRLVDEQMAKLHRLIAQALKPHQEVVARLAEVPGFGPDSAQQVIAAWFGRFRMRQSLMSSKAPTATPKPGNGALGPWHEPYANSATTSRSRP